MPGRLLWRCKACGHDTSVTAGTVLHRTRTPLTQWFWSAYLVTTQTPGLSALQLQRQLGIRRYETAWTMLHKLRGAMVRPGREPLKDKVEVDETYIGGPEAGLRGGRELIEKALVVGAVEVRGKASGRVRLQVVPDASGWSLTGFVKANVTRGAMVLTDAWGAVIAASHKPSNYYHVDQDWWTATFRDAAGGIHVGDVNYDSISRTNFLAIDVPVLSRGRDQAIGVLRAIVDVEEMRPITAQIQVGAKGDAMLVKDDGTIISSRNVALVMKQKAEELEVVASMAAERASGYTSASLKGGAQKFIAFADPGLSQAFPEVKWKVIVAQDLQEVRAPIARVTNRALATVFGGVLLFGLLAAYFSLHRPQKFTDIEGAGT